jgi:hypothetical protein
MRLSDPMLQTRFRALSRIFKGSIALRSFTGADCRNRNYDRRNADYRHLHGLCSVPLDGVGLEPGPGRGEFVPFGIWMPQLFQQTVLLALRAGRPADRSAHSNRAAWPVRAAQPSLG